MPKRPPEPLSSDGKSLHNRELPMRLLTLVAVLKNAHVLVGRPSAFKLWLSLRPRLRLYQ